MDKREGQGSEQPLTLEDFGWPPEGSAPNFAFPAEVSRAEYLAAEIEHLARSFGDPGTRIGSKEELRELAKVSVGTLNEALRLAQVRGAVTLRRGPGGGIFVGPAASLMGVGTRMLGFEMNDHLLVDAMRIRNALDPLIISDAITNAQANDVMQLRQITDDMRASLWNRDVDAFIRLHWAYQRRIADISPSKMLRSMFDEVLQTLDARTVALLDGDDPSDESVADHVALHERMTEALNSRDREAALRVMRDYLNSQGMAIEDIEAQAATP